MHRSPQEEKTNSSRKLYPDDRIFCSFLRLSVHPAPGWADGEFDVQASQLKEPALKADAPRQVYLKPCISTTCNPGLRARVIPRGAVPAASRWDSRRLRSPLQRHSTAFGQTEPPHTPGCEAKHHARAQTRQRRPALP